MPEADVWRPLWRVAGRCVLLALVSAAGLLSVPFVVQRATDSVLTETNDPAKSTGVGGWVVLALVLVIGSSIASSVMAHQLNKGAERVLATVRERAFRHIHALAGGQRTALGRGGLTAQVTHDIDQITAFLQKGGFYLLPNVAQVLLSASLMAVYSWPLALGVVTLLVPLFWILPALHRRLVHQYAQVQEHTGKVLSLTDEVLAGAEVLRSSGAQKRMERQLADAIDTQYVAQQRVHRLSTYAVVLGEGVVTILTLTIVVVGMALGAHGDLTVGELTAYLFLVARFVQPLQSATETLNDLQNAVAAVGRVQHLLAMVPAVRPPAAHRVRVLPSGPLDVGLDRISFTYPNSDTPAVRALSVEVPAGCRMAVVGATGSGKSTLLSLLTRGVDPQEGQVRIGGVELDRLRPSDHRKAVHLIPQDGFLFRGTIRDNLRLAAPGMADDGVLDTFDRLGLSSWLGGLSRGIDTPVGEGGRLLSAGERQLVAMARAFAADPRVLLLDEATSQVDPLTESRMAKALAVLAQGRTFIAVAHRLSTAEQSDEIMVMQDGILAQRGTHGELHAVPGPYAALYAVWRRRTRDVRPEDH